MTPTVSFYLKSADTSLRSVCNQIADMPWKAARSLRVAVDTLRDLGAVFSRWRTEEPDLPLRKTLVKNCAYSVSGTLTLQFVSYTGSLIAYVGMGAEKPASFSTETEDAMYNTALAVVICVTAIAINQAARQHMLYTDPESSAQRYFEVVGAVYSSTLIADVSEAMLTCVVGGPIAQEVAWSMRIVSCIFDFAENLNRCDAISYWSDRNVAQRPWSLEEKCSMTFMLAVPCLAGAEFTTPLQTHALCIVTGGYALLTTNRRRADQRIASQSARHHSDQLAQGEAPIFSRAISLGGLGGMVAGKIVRSHFLGGGIIGAVLGGMNASVEIAGPHLLKTYENKCRDIFLVARDRELCRVQKIHTRRGHLPVFPKEIWQKVMSFVVGEVPGDSGVIPFQEFDLPQNRNRFFLLS